MLVLVGRWSVKLGRLHVSTEPTKVRGGNSIFGDAAIRGELEKAEPVSDTSDGVPSSESDLDASEADGEGSGASIRAWTENGEGDMVREQLVVGLVKESGLARSWKVSEEG